jgi:hypothetical protein
MSRIKAAPSRIFRVVEPESDVEGIRPTQAHHWIESEDLVPQDGFDRQVDCAFAICLEIALVPGKSEVLNRASRPLTGCCSA